MMNTLFTNLRQPVSQLVRQSLLKPSFAHRQQSLIRVPMCFFSNNSNTIYLKNLRFENEVAIRSALERFGTIQGVNFLKVTRGDEPGIRGFVQFENESSAKQAVAELKDKGIDIENERVSVDFAKSTDKRNNRGDDQRRTLYFGNLAYGTTQDDLKSLCERYGSVKSVSLPLND